MLPGQTPGSLALLLAHGRAFNGDMVLGGWLGGALFAQRVGSVELLRRPLRSVYLGHGGPVSRDSVLRGLDLADPRRPG